MEPLADKIKETITQIIGADWDLVNTTDKVSYSEKLSTGRYSLRSNAGFVFASFELHPMINCCGICVSTAAWVHKDYQHRGLGLLLNSIRIDIAQNLEYGLLLCTDVENNIPQRKILKQNGWKDVHRFINPRTRNTICISVINL